MSKNDDLVSALRAGWQDMHDLQSLLHWTPTSIRGAISAVARKHNLKIERRRIDGLTSYRVAPDVSL